MKKRRDSWKSLSAWARCHECDFEVHSKNAQAVAAKHCDKYGHVVEVYVEKGITYAPKGKHDTCPIAPF